MQNKIELGDCRRSYEYTVTLNEGPNAGMEMHYGYQTAEHILQNYHEELDPYQFMDLYTDTVRRRGLFAQKDDSARRQELESNRFGSYPVIKEKLRAIVASKELLSVHINRNVGVRTIRKGFAVVPDTSIRSLTLSFKNGTTDYMSCNDSVIILQNFEDYLDEESSNDEEIIRVRQLLNELPLEKDAEDDSRAMLAAKLVKATSPANERLSFFKRNLKLEDAIELENRWERSEEAELLENPNFHYVP